MRFLWGFLNRKKKFISLIVWGDNQYETQRKTIYCTQNSVTISIGDRCRSVVPSLKKNWKDDLGTTGPYVLKSNNLRRTKMALILSWYSRISSIQLEWRTTHGCFWFFTGTWSWTAYGSSFFAHRYLLVKYNANTISNPSVLIFFIFLYT